MLLLYALAGILEVLRLAVETRRGPLVDLALDCVQRLIAHHCVAGPVYIVAHRREANARVPRKSSAAEDDEPSLAGEAEAMPPQVGGLELTLQNVTVHKVL